MGGPFRRNINPYGGHGSTVWWNQVKSSLEKVRNLSVISLPPDAPQALAKLAQRTMKLQCTIQDGQIWLSDGTETVHIELTKLM